MVDQLVVHFTHVDNLAGIFADGAMLANTVMKERGTNHIDCADANIKAHRAQIPIQVSPHGVVGDYVPFYFAPRSPMLFRISKGGVATYTKGQEGLVYLVTSVEAVLGARLSWVGSDGNCAASTTSHYNDWDQLQSVIDWPLLKEKYWSNTAEDGDRVRRRQAEFLVHRLLPTTYIQAIVTKTENVATRERMHVGNAVPVYTRPGWYY